MVHTRQQLANMSKEELIEEIMSISDLHKRFDDFEAKYAEISSQLAIVKTVNSRLLDRIMYLEKNTLSTSQYHRRETIEINPVPHDIDDQVLEDTVCEALSLTGHTVTPDDLQACHRLKRKDRVIVKFSSRKLKNKIVKDRKKLNEKGRDLTNLKFSGKLFVSESMCKENQDLFYICRQLKTAKKIHATWFYNNVINMKLHENDRPTKIYHKCDIEELLQVENIDEFLRDASF